MIKLNIALDEYGHLDDKTLVDSLISIDIWSNLVNDGRISIADFIIMVSRDESIHFDVKHKVVRDLLHDGV